MREGARARLRFFSLNVERHHDRIAYRSVDGNAKLPLSGHRKRDPIDSIFSVAHRRDLGRDRTMLMRGHPRNDCDLRVVDRSSGSRKQPNFSRVRASYRRRRTEPKLGRDRISGHRFVRIVRWWPGITRARHEHDCEKKSHGTLMKNAACPCGDVSSVSSQSPNMWKRTYQHFPIAAAEHPDVD